MRLDCMAKSIAEKNELVKKLAIISLEEQNFWDFSGFPPEVREKFEKTADKELISKLIKEVQELKLKELEQNKIKTLDLVKICYIFLDKESVLSKVNEYNKTRFLIITIILQQLVLKQQIPTKYVDIAIAKDIDKNNL